MIEVSERTFEHEVGKHAVALVEFGAEWCPPCRVLEPILNELEAQLGNLAAILQVDCDDSPQLASQYGVMSMPTVVIFHNGEPVEKLVGLRPKSVYQSMLARYIQ